MNRVHKAQSSRASSTKGWYKPKKSSKFSGNAVEKVKSERLMQANNLIEKVNQTLDEFISIKITWNDNKISAKIPKIPKIPEMPEMPEMPTMQAMRKIRPLTVINCYNPVRIMTHSDNKYIRDTANFVQREFSAALLSLISNPAKFASLMSAMGLYVPDVAMESLKLEADVAKLANFATFTRDTAPDRWCKTGKHLGKLITKSMTHARTGGKEEDIAKILGNLIVSYANHASKKLEKKLPTYAHAFAGESRKVYNDKIAPRLTAAADKLIKVYQENISRNNITNEESDAAEAMDKSVPVEKKRRRKFYHP